MNWLLFFIYFLKISHTNANKIWIIRHCDKPNNPKNPCCSDTGYDRSIGWANYFKDYLGNNNNRINIITSDFHSKTKCVDKLNHTKNNCQKSQRMLLTTYYLSKQLLDMNYKIDTINLNYCVGDSGKIFHHIQTMKNTNDIILVWEHHEIVDFIRKYNIKIRNWKRKVKHNFDIVFMIDTKKNKLYYSCYNYKEKTKNKCSRDVDKWLGNFDNIDNSVIQKPNVFAITPTVAVSNLHLYKQVIFIVTAMIITICGVYFGLILGKYITKYHYRYQYIEIQ